MHLEGSLDPRAGHLLGRTFGDTLPSLDTPKPVYQVLTQSEFISSIFLFDWANS